MSFIEMNDQILLIKMKLDMFTSVLGTSASFVASLRVFLFGCIFQLGWTIPVES